MLIEFEGHLFNQNKENAGVMVVSPYELIQNESILLMVKWYLKIHLFLQPLLTIK